MTAYAYHTLGHILPFETLKQIFEVAFDDLVTEYKSDDHHWFYLDFPLVLGATCRYWRDVALQTPLLWTFVQINLGRYTKEERDDDGGELLRLWIAQSQNLPLQLCIEGFNRAENYTKDIYPLSLVDLDRVSSFSLAYRGDDYPQTRFSLTLGKALEINFVGGRLEPDHCSGLYLPQVHTARFLTIGLLEFLVVHPTIRSLTIEWQEAGELADIWQSNWGDVPLKRLALVSTGEPRSPPAHFLMHNKHIEELTLDGCKPPFWTRLKRNPSLIPRSHLRVRRDAGLFFTQFLYLFHPDGPNIGARLVLLELTDTRWNQTPWYCVLKSLPNLIELWIEYNGPQGDTASDYGNPTTIVNELPKVHPHLASLSKISIISVEPLTSHSLVHFAFVSPRKLEMTFSSNCFIIERQILEQFPLITVFIAAPRHTEGIRRRKMLPWLYYYSEVSRTRSLPLLNLVSIE